ncbi:cyclase associated protein 1 [Actinidia rufa]|uniref:Cyclase associated protein 1 n=1 Tax=Actinidia rufa TaxID=165716 RepID=A0A7J0E291_9ERIC|nr:cyclase associated protein 1 [Actinidia rufa]
MHIYTLAYNEPPDLREREGINGGEADREAGIGGGAARGAVFGVPAGCFSGDAAEMDLATIAFDDLIPQFIGRASVAAEKIGGQVLDVTKVLAEAFSAQRELLVKVKQSQAMWDFTHTFPHAKRGDVSLTALAWIAFTGKDCGMSMPISCGRASTSVSAPAKASTSVAPAPPPPPPASLFSSEPPQSSSPRPKEGMAAVFLEISSGKSVTLGLRKVTDDMKAKNCADRTGIIGASEKETSVRSPSVSQAGPPKFELQMVRKVNNITVDKCTKMGLVFTDVVAACEIVNCNGVGVQCQVSISFLNSVHF